MDLITSKLNKASSPSSEMFFPRIELKETEKNYTISLEISGMKEKDIHTKIKDNNLIIEGEKKYEKEKTATNYFSSEFYYGSFYRSIPLPETVSKKISTSYKDGVFLITLDKSVKQNVNQAVKKKRTKKVLH